MFPAASNRAPARRALRVPGLPDALRDGLLRGHIPQRFRARATGDTAHVGYILNLTDDAWFGRTAGPYQHFAQARLRAVELGLPMLRVANGGISAIVDARGRVIEDAPLGFETVIDGGLPGALPPTWQARWGAATFLALTALAGLACVVAPAALIRANRNPRRPNVELCNLRKLMVE